MKRIGVLAFHGDVIEHIHTTIEAARNLKLRLKVLPIRTKESVNIIDGLIIPGGESTTLYKLIQREGMWENMKKLKNIFGTCAGAIMLAKKIYHEEQEQKTLQLMDIEIDRNAYGSQTESFEKPIKTSLGKINAVFIRAPKITKIGKDIKILARDGNEILACEQKNSHGFYLAACFHPELTSNVFHQYFLQKIYAASPR